MKARLKQNEQGQITILMALLITSFVMVAAFAIDGGFGLFESRQAQNAADFGSLAASQLMPCNTSANSSVTGAQVQSTVQKLVNDNDPGVTTTWTGQYLDDGGSPITGATFTGTSAYTPPSNACGVKVSVTGSWTATLARVGGFNQLSTNESAGAMGSGSSGSSLAIASLLPYWRHTIYAGAVGNFKVNGSMFDNSVAQCNDRDNSCLNYTSQCGSGTPVGTIICYGDSADVFQQSTESITGTLYSVAPVALDPCFYPAPSSGSVSPMSSRSGYYTTYGCGTQFSSAASPISYGGMQGNTTVTSDPLSTIADPSGNGGAATECPGQSSVTSYGSNYTWSETSGSWWHRTSTNYAARVVSSGAMSPGVYTTPVIISGSVTLAPCQSGGSTTGPGIYVFQDGLQICPSSTSTVSGSNVMLYNESLIPQAYASDDDTAGPTLGACAADDGGSGGAVPDGITIGGASGGKVNLSGPTSGIYKGLVLYQDRSVNANVGLDDGWMQPTTTTYKSDGATITIDGVLYDNSFNNSTNQNATFSEIGQTYGGPYGSLCTGTTDDALSGDPVPCPGIPNSVNLSNTSGNVTINGAVVVGAFGTQGGTSSSPMNLTITYDSSAIPLSVGNLRLIF